jgi:hypothetical protein
MKWGDCQKDLPMKTNFTFGNATIDKLEMSGTANVTEEFKDFEMNLELFKCSLDMKSCERYVTPPPIPEICEKLLKKDEFYSSILQAIEPRFVCPVKPGIYKMNFISYTIPSIFQYIRFGGQVWISKFQFIDRKTRKAKACLNAETKVLNKRVRNRK